MRFLTFIKRMGLGKPQHQILELTRWCWSYLLQSQYHLSIISRSSPNKMPCSNPILCSQKMLHKKPHLSPAVIMALALPAAILTKPTICCVSSRLNGGMTFTRSWVVKCVKNAQKNGSTNEISWTVVFGQKHLTCQATHIQCAACWA